MRKQRPSIAQRKSEVSNSLILILFPASLRMPWLFCCLQNLRRSATASELFCCSMRRASPTWGTKRRSWAWQQNGTHQVGLVNWLQDRTWQHQLFLPALYPLTLRTLLPSNSALSPALSPNSSPLAVQATWADKMALPCSDPARPWIYGELWIPLFHTKLLTVLTAALFSCGISWALSPPPELRVASFSFLFSTTLLLIFCLCVQFVTMHPRLPHNQGGDRYVFIFSSDSDVLNSPTANLVYFLFKDSRRYIKE